MRGTNFETLRLNGRNIDLQRGTVADASGSPQTLRPQSAAVLRVLIARQGQLVTKDELAREVWGNVAVTDDSLVQCVTEIRKALGDDNHVFVKTVLKRGYILDTPRDQGWSRHLRLGLSLAALSVIGLIALLLYQARGAPESKGPPTIAVLPFDDMNSDRSLGYLGSGVSEDIIAMLARSPDLIVLARNSSFIYGGQPKDVRQIGKELGATYVLEGSVRREADKLRIVAQLDDARTGHHVWAESFDRSGTDPRALQDEVTGKIIGSLIGERGELKRAQYRDAWGKDVAELAEYDFYLRGLDLFMNAENKADYDRAGDIWQEGLKRYPSSSLIKVKLGWYHWQLAWDFWSDDIAADFRTADQIVTEVLAQPNLAPEVRRLAYSLNAFVLMERQDFEAAVAEAKNAVSMTPYDAHMLRILVEVAAAAGEYDLALQWLKTAEAREQGRSDRYRQLRGYIYRLMGRYQGSIDEYRKAGPLRAYPRLSLAISYSRLGRLGEARDEVRRAIDQAPDFTQARWRQGSFYSDPTILDNELADLATAGLPEK